MVAGSPEASAWTSERKASPVRAGKRGEECVMMSVCEWPSAERRKRMARPRGLALGSVSGIWGRPVEEEKRARRGVVGLLK